MTRQATRGKLIWPADWNHRLIKPRLHVAAGHVIRHVTRHWYVQCPHGDFNGVNTVARGLSLRDVIDDLTVHLPRCCWEEVCSRSPRGPGDDAWLSTKPVGMR